MRNIIHKDLKELRIKLRKNPVLINEEIKKYKYNLDTAKTEYEKTVNYLYLNSIVSVIKEKNYKTTANGLLSSFSYSFKTEIPLLLKGDILDVFSEEHFYKVFDKDAVFVHDYKVLDGNNNIWRLNILTERSFFHHKIEFKK